MTLEEYLKKLFDFLENIPCHTHYEVPRCPICSSVRTGRYVKEFRSEDTTWTQKEGYKHGEYIIAVKDVPYCNLFCLECGHNWPGDATFKLISSKTLKEKRMQRKTGILLQQQIEEEKKEKKQFAKDHKLRYAIKKITGL